MSSMRSRFERHVCTAANTPLVDTATGASYGNMCVRKLPFTERYRDKSKDTEGAKPVAEPVAELVVEQKHILFTESIDDLFEVATMYLFNGMAKGAAENEPANATNVLNYLMYTIPEADKLFVVDLTAHPAFVTRRKYVRVIFDEDDYCFRVFVAAQSGAKPTGPIFKDIAGRCRRIFRRAVHERLRSSGQLEQKNVPVHELWKPVVQAYRMHLIKVLKEYLAWTKDDRFVGDLDGQIESKWLLGKDDIEFAKPLYGAGNVKVRLKETQGEHEEALHSFSNAYFADNYLSFQNYRTARTLNGLFGYGAFLFDFVTHKDNNFTNADDFGENLVANEKYLWHDIRALSVHQTERRKGVCDTEERYHALTTIVDVTGTTLYVSDQFKAMVRMRHQKVMEHLAKTVALAKLEAAAEKIAAKLTENDGVLSEEQVFMDQMRNEMDENKYVFRVLMHLQRENWLLEKHTVSIEGNEALNKQEMGDLLRTSDIPNCQRGRATISDGVFVTKEQFRTTRMSPNISSLKECYRDPALRVRPIDIPKDTKGHMYGLCNYELRLDEVSMREYFDHRNGSLSQSRFVASADPISMIRAAMQLFQGFQKFYSCLTEGEGKNLSITRTPFNAHGCYYVLEKTMEKTRTQDEHQAGTRPLMCSDLLVFMDLLHTIVSNPGVLNMLTQPHGSQSKYKPMVANAGFCMYGKPLPDYPTTGAQPKQNWLNILQMTYEKLRVGASGSENLRMQNRASKLLNVDLCSHTETAREAFGRLVYNSYTYVDVGSEAWKTTLHKEADHIVRMWLHNRGGCKNCTDFLEQQDDYELMVQAFEEGEQQSLHEWLFYILFGETITLFRRYVEEIQYEAYKMARNDDAFKSYLEQRKNDTETRRFQVFLSYMQAQGSGNAKYVHLSALGEFAKFLQGVMASSFLKNVTTAFFNGTLHKQQHGYFHNLDTEIAEHFKEEQHRQFMAQIYSTPQQRRQQFVHPEKNDGLGDCNNVKSFSELMEQNVPSGGDKKKPHMLHAYVLSMVKAATDNFFRTEDQHKNELVNPTQKNAPHKEDEVYEHRMQMMLICEEHLHLLNHLYHRTKTKDEPEIIVILFAGFKHYRQQWADYYNFYTANLRGAGAGAAR